MSVKLLTGIVLLLPSFALSADLCKDAKTTLEINECLSTHVAAADKELAKYLQESRHRYADKPNVIKSLNKTQKAWIQFRRDHCDAVYELWSEGSIRNTLYEKCMLYQTQRRTHDIWKTYLTYYDSSPPILPEPRLDDKEK